MKKWVPLLCLVFLAIIGSFYLAQSKKESSIEQSKKDLKIKFQLFYYMAVAAMNTLSRLFQRNSFKKKIALQRSYR